jgi:branched-chain amino acid transport system substrate-binding protein
MNEIGYNPHAIMAQAAGFQESGFLIGAAGLTEGVMSRSSFALDATKSRPAIEPVNALYKAHNNKDMNDNTSRDITALLTLADAINRSGTGKPDDIRKALIATDIKGVDTIMPWTGVRFDESGQNVLGTPVIQQVTGGVYHTIWPFEVAVQPAIWNVGQ